MRVAILFSLERALGDDGPCCAALSVGHRSVLERQVALAKSLGCERIACFADGVEPHILGAQRLAEEAGIKFAVMSGRAGLSGLVRANDTLVLIADGVVLPAHEVQPLIGEGQAVVTLPVDEGVAAGFERIDREVAWAGILSASGGLVEAMMELPDDFGIESSMLRLALQRGIRTKQVDPAMLKARDLVLVRTMDDAQAWSERRVDRLLPAPDAWQVETRLADKLARQFMKLDAPMGWRLVTTYGAWLLVLLAVLYLAVSGQAVTALAILPLAPIFLATGQRLERLWRDGRVPTGVAAHTTQVLPFLADASFIAAASQAVRGELALSAAFAALMLVGLQQLARFQGRAAPIKIAADRTLVFVMVAAGAILGIFYAGIQVLAIALLVALIWDFQRQN